MIIEPDVLIQALMLIAAGVSGFGLGGLSTSDNNKLRGIGWFIAGLAVGVVIPAIAVAFTTDI